MNLIAGDFMQYFPKLEQLRLPDWDSVTLGPALKPTLKLNPQLKHLMIPRGFWEILQLVNENRPDLISLEVGTLLYYDRDSVPVLLRFNNMTSFKCKDSM